MLYCVIAACRGDDINSIIAKPISKYVLGRQSGMVRAMANLCIYISSTFMVCTHFSIQSIGIFTLAMIPVRPRKRRGAKVRKVFSHSIAVAIFLKDSFVLLVDSKRRSSYVSRDASPCWNAKFHTRPNISEAFLVAKFSLWNPSILIKIFVINCMERRAVARQFSLLSSLTLFITRSLCST